MKPLIAHFLNYAKPSGLTEMQYAAATHSKFKHVYVTYTCDAWLAHRFASTGIQVYQLGDGQFDAAVAFVREERVSILHAQNSGGPEPGVAIGLKAGLATVETCQSPSLPTGHVHASVHVVAVSHGLLRWWPDGVRPRRVIYNCAFKPETLLSKAECKQHFGLDPIRPVVGRIGRLEGIKRPQDFVRAAHVIGRERPDVQFLLVGDGSDGKGVRKMAHQLEDESGIHITLPGFLVDHEKAMALHAMDVFLYPTSMEGFCVSFAEAMSIGLPIVTYSDPVNVDVVGPAGLFVPDNEYSSASRPFSGLARMTIDLLENPRECDKLAKYGRQIYAERYTPEQMAEQYDALYEEMLR